MRIQYHPVKPMAAGSRYGRLVLTGVGAIREYTEGRSRRKTAMFWECICDCGWKGFRMGAYLRNGTVRSCGCLRGRKKEGTS